MTRVDPRDRARVEDAITRALSKTDAAEHEIEYRLRSEPGDEPRWVAARATTLRDEFGRPVRMIGTLMDITEAEAGMMNLQREPVDLCQLGREVVELYQYVAEEKNRAVH